MKTAEEWSHQFIEEYYGEHATAIIGVVAERIIQQAMDEAAIKALEWAASNHEKECYLCQSTIKVMGKNSDITPCLEWKKLHAEIERRKQEARHA